MTDKPSILEEEYFAKQEVERRRKIAEEHQAKIAKEDKDRQRQLHFMRCPKCGSQLEEISFGEVHVDKCFICGGFWLDNGEIEILLAQQPGFVGRLFKVFR